MLSLSPSTTLKIVSALICESYRDRKRVETRERHTEIIEAKGSTLLYIIFLSSMTSSVKQLFPLAFALSLFQMQCGSVAFFIASTLIGVTLFFPVQSVHNFVHLLL